MPQRHRHRLGQRAIRVQLFSCGHRAPGAPPTRGGPRAWPAAADARAYAPNAARGWAQCAGLCVCLRARARVFARACMRACDRASGRGPGRLFSAGFHLLSMHPLALLSPQSLNDEACHLMGSGDEHDLSRAEDLLQRALAIEVAELLRAPPYGCRCS